MKNTTRNIDGRQFVQLAAGWPEDMAREAILFRNHWRRVRVIPAAGGISTVWANGRMHGKGGAHE